MDTEMLNGVNPITDTVAHDATEPIASAANATVVASAGTTLASQESAQTARPANGSPTGWTLIVASVAIALAVLLILGVGFGIGYLLDLRNGVDTFNAGAGSSQCVTNT